MRIFLWWGNIMLTVEFSYCGVVGGGWRKQSQHPHRQRWRRRWAAAFVGDMCEPRQVCSVSQQVSGRNLPLAQVFAAPARDFTLYPSLALRTLLRGFFLDKPFRVLRSLRLLCACEVCRSQPPVQSPPTSGLAAEGH